MAAASSFDPPLCKCCRCDSAMEYQVPMVLWDYKPLARGFDQSSGSLLQFTQRQTLFEEVQSKRDLDDVKVIGACCARLFFQKPYYLFQDHVLGSQIIQSSHFHVASLTSWWKIRRALSAHGLCKQDHFVFAGKFR